MTDEEYEKRFDKMLNKVPEEFRTFIRNNVYTITSEYCDDDWEEKNYRVLCEQVKEFMTCLTNYRLS